MLKMDDLNDSATRKFANNGCQIVHSVYFSIMANGDVLTVREAASLLDVGVSTLKRWADAGILASFRTVGGHRRFARHEVERLRIQSRSREVAWADLYTKENDPLVIAAELLRARARLGSWWATADEVGGALHEVGRRWEAGEITVLQEHHGSERLARGLQYAAQSIPLRPDAPACLLAMAEDDDHTLGLSLAEITLREAGWGSHWAGRRTPLVDIVSAVHHREVQMVALSASCLSDDPERLRRFSETVAGASRVARVELVMGGRGAWPEQPQHGHRLESFGELHRLLADGGRTQRGRL